MDAVCLLIRLSPHPFQAIDAQRIGFDPPCDSMVDKTGWTEPLDSGRGGLGFEWRPGPKELSVGYVEAWIARHMGAGIDASGLVQLVIR